MNGHGHSDDRYTAKPGNDCTASHIQILPGRHGDVRMRPMRAEASVAFDHGRIVERAATPLARDAAYAHLWNLRLLEEQDELKRAAGNGLTPA